LNESQLHYTLTVQHPFQALDQIKLVHRYPEICGDVEVLPLKRENVDYLPHLPPQGQFREELELFWLERGCRQAGVPEEEEAFADFAVPRAEILT
jgi:hypothetical protein